MTAQVSPRQDDIPYEKPVEPPCYGGWEAIVEDGTEAFIAANRVLYDTPALRRWRDLEEGVRQLLAEADKLDAEALLERENDIVGSVMVQLPRRHRGPYLNKMRKLQVFRETWAKHAPSRKFTIDVHRALLWHSALHMLTARVGVSSVIRALGIEHATWLKLVGNFAISRSMSTIAASKRFVSSVKRPQSKPGKMTRPQPVAKVDAVTVPCERPQASTEQVISSPAQPDARPQTSVSSARGGRLHAQAMRGSIVKTWLGLVVFSWISLAWSAAITSFVGVGLVIGFFSAFGAVLIPVWGTIWGFAGMGRAHSRTLREIEFKDVGDEHPLAQSLQQMSQALGIPRPRIGTMPIANAFAMGTNQADATIAIGEPLMSRLMRDEIDAIIGHELGHVISGDMRRMMLMRTFQNATVWFAVAQGAKQAVRWVLCFFAELFIQRFSRKREFVADAIGAALTSKEAMIGALRAIEGHSSDSSFEKTHARFMFHTPISFHWSFCSHPPIADRIAALEQETYIAQLPRL